jgi:hypothetical protein
VATISVTLATDPVMERLSVSASPVAGPWVLLSPMFAQHEDPGVVIGLVLDGVVQTAGAVLAIIGLLTRERSPLSTALGPRPEAPQLAVVPWSPSGGGAGLTLALTHL